MPRYAAIIPAGWAYLAVDFSNTITLGAAIIAAAVGLAGLAVLGYGARWKAAATAEKAVSESYRDGREAFKARADRLEVELRETRTRNEDLALLIGEQKKTIAKLEGERMPERIVVLMSEFAERQENAARDRLASALDKVGLLFTEAIDRHDERAEARTTRLLEAIIADRRGA